MFKITSNKPIIRYGKISKSHNNVTSKVVVKFYVTTLFCQTKLLLPIPKFMPLQVYICMFVYIQCTVDKGMLYTVAI